MSTRDRFTALQLSTQWNGIDFVEVDAADASILRVHFLNAVTVAEPGLKARIEGGDRVREVATAPIKPADWLLDAEARPLLILHLLGEGDFSNYRLTLAPSGKLDRAYASVVFSFKALCPTEFDCEAEAPDCPPDDTPLPPIDYLAKDFLSFREALSEFSSLRYPEWRERSEADFGMVVMEALSAVADELSYMQDRISAEATLETATQRRSLVSLARLVDYEPLPATSASTMILCTVLGGPLPAGLRISAPTPDGALIPFEIGTGINDKAAYVVSPRWNYGIEPYWWDDAERCLPRGATGMWLTGDGFGFTPGLALLIQTDLPGDSHRQIVHLTEIEEAEDPLFPPGGPPTKVTRIAWGTSEALERDRDLTLTQIGGNLLPATQGQRVFESFTVDPSTASGFPPAAAIARRGPNGNDVKPNWVYRYALKRPPLAWLNQPKGGSPLPEIRLIQRQPEVQDWSYAASLLSADQLEPSFTVDPAAWRPVGVGADRVSPQFEYDGDNGDTIRFGDGVFGAPPVAGDMFEIAYRSGAGAAGNVAADTIGHVDTAWIGLVSSARNPFAVTDGADAETPEHIRRMAPQAFRAKQFRAVRREDYEAAAEELPWVQQAGTAFRWTGSWLTVFTAADPRASEAVDVAQQTELVQLLNRRRLAGYESYVPPPRYVSVDLRIDICVQPYAVSSDVEKAVLDRLGGGSRRAEDGGFFFADHFTFGTPLYRSRIEAVVQETPGVKGVLSINFRRRGVNGAFVSLPEQFPLSSDEILRVDNDPDYPERGTIRVTTEGGR